MKKTVTEHNVLRYNRQIALPQFDIDGQETLLNAKVLLIGLGDWDVHAHNILPPLALGR